MYEQLSKLLARLRANLLLSQGEFVIVVILVVAALFLFWRSRP